MINAAAALAGQPGLAQMMVSLVVGLAFLIFFIACGWKIYAKAGQPGWAVLIPIYSTIVLCKIVGKPSWWVVLTLIPLVGPIIALVLVFNLATVFGKSGGFAVGMIFLGFIFFPILAFGSSRYIGPGGNALGMGMGMPGAGGMAGRGY